MSIVVRHPWLATLLALGSGALQAQEAVAPLRHNPFNRPDYVVALAAGPAANAGVTPVAALELRATLVADGIRLANIDGEILAVGQRYAGYRLMRVEEGKAFLRKGGEQLVLDAYARQTGADKRSP